MKYIVTYGIACVLETNGKQEVVAALPDITINKLEIERIVKLCNELQLSPDHLWDVADDLLATI